MQKSKLFIFLYNMIILKILLQENRKNFYCYILLDHNKWSHVHKHMTIVFRRSGACMIMNLSHDHKHTTIVFRRSGACKIINRSHDHKHLTIVLRRSGACKIINLSNDHKHITNFSGAVEHVL